MRDKISKWPKLSFWMVSFLLSVALQALGAIVGNAQEPLPVCQNQVCLWIADCYRCSNANDFACSVEISDCNTCTERHCSGAPLLDNAGKSQRAVLVSSPSRKSACTTTNDGSGEQPGPPKRATRVGMLRQTATPARLGVTKHGRQSLFLGGVLENGTRKLIGYRIGWVVDVPGQPTEAKLSDWWPIPDGLEPGGKRDIPGQGVSGTLIDQGATRVEFFVAAVKFADGTTWEANLQEIKKILPANTTR